LLILVLGLALIYPTFAQDKPVWKGKIKYEDGVKVIENPKEPLFGEITFDLDEDLVIGNEEDENYKFYGPVINIRVDSNENIFVLDGGNCRIQKYNRNGKYLQTIGRRGQGPGEFQYILQIYVDSKNYLYVYDLRRIHIFNNKGQYEKTIPISLYNFPPQFGITGDGAIFGIIVSHTSESNESTEIVLFNKEGKKMRTVESYIGLKPVFFKEGKPSRLSSFYKNRVYFCMLNDSTGVYGNSSEYKLNIISSTGKLKYVIEKKEDPEGLSNEDKKKEIDGKAKEYARGTIQLTRREVKKLMKFPEHKPFFDSILKDNEGNIYVKKGVKCSRYREGLWLDFFNSKGFYLYRIASPVYFQLVKQSRVYEIRIDEETGYAFIKIHKIKNWDQLREYSPPS
jgi:hypothetical protein